MNLQEMIKLWPQYQNWLKNNNININNAKEKTAEVITQLNNNPEQKKQLQTFFSNPGLVNLAKKFNVSDQELTEIQNLFIDSKSQFSGNLSQEQLNKIKRLRK